MRKEVEVEIPQPLEPEILVKKLYDEKIPINKICVIVPCSRAFIDRCRYIFNLKSRYDRTEEYSRIKQNALQGKSIRIIARDSNTTIASTRYALQKMNISIRDLRKINEVEIIKMYQQNKKLIDIYQKHKISAQTIKKILEKNKVKKRKHIQQTGFASCGRKRTLSKKEYLVLWRKRNHDYRVCYQKKRRQMLD